MKNRPNGPEPVTAKADDRPNGVMALSELEKLQMENYALRHNLLQEQVRQVIAERTGYIKKMEADHPGYMWDERQGLVPRHGMTPPQLAGPQELKQ